MTDAASKGRGVSSERASSTLPFDPADLMSMRVSPAKFAAMCGVSKQAVSQWIKRGTITLMPDGTLDPVKASRQVFDNSDPARLRARIFKNAMQPREELLTRVDELQSMVAALRAQLRALEFRSQDREARGVQKFCLAIEDRFEDLVKAAGQGDLDVCLDELARIAFGWDDSSAAVPLPENCAADSDSDGALKGVRDAAAAPAEDCATVSPAKVPD